MVNEEESRHISIVSMKYWKEATSQSNNIRVICMISLLIALHVAISSLFIPVGESLRIYFSFIPMCIASIIGGPVFALAYGMIADLLGVLLHPSGPFFPGYTLSSMLCALIFALFLYNTKITLSKIILSKLIMNVCVNVCLNSLWASILFNKGFYYFAAKSIVKNIGVLPFEVILLVIVIKLVIPIADKFGVIPKNTQIKL